VSLHRTDTLSVGGLFCLRWRFELGLVVVSACAALVFQSYWRGTLARKERARRERVRAAIVIERVYRGRRTRRGMVVRLVYMQAHKQAPPTILRQPLRARPKGMRVAGWQACRFVDPSLLAWPPRQAGGVMAVVHGTVAARLH
jgi:hypothetical protein